MITENFEQIFRKLLHFNYFIEGDDRAQKEEELRQALRKLETKYATQQIVPVIKECGNRQVNRIHTLLFCVGPRVPTSHQNCMQHRLDRYNLLFCSKLNWWILAIY